MKALEILNLKIIEQVLNKENRVKLKEAIAELEELETKITEQSFIDKIYDSFENRSCDNCKFKYVVDSMTTECQHNDSPIDYVDLDCFPTFSCNVWELKQ